MADERGVLLGDRTARRVIRATRIVEAGGRGRGTVWKRRRGKRAGSAAASGKGALSPGIVIVDVAASAAVDASSIDADDVTTALSVSPGITPDSVVVLQWSGDYTALERKTRAVFGSPDEVEFIPPVPGVNLSRTDCRATGAEPVGAWGRLVEYQDPEIEGDDKRAYLFEIYSLMDLRALPNFDEAAAQIAWHDADAPDFSLDAEECE